MVKIAIVDGIHGSKFEEFSGGERGKSHPVHEEDLRNMVGIGVVDDYNGFPILNRILVKNKPNIYIQDLT